MYLQTLLSITTLETKKIDTSSANVLAIALKWLYSTRFYDLVLVWALSSM